MSDQKERLERELRFLKESLDAGVISKDEYEKGKARVDRKLSEVEETPSKPEIEIKEIKHERPHLTQESKEETLKPKAEIHEKNDIWEEETQRPVKKNKKTIYYIAFILLIVLVYFFMKPAAIPETLTNLTVEDEFKPLCIEDSDCEKSNKIGICENPNTKEASCLFKDPVETKLTILNDENCLSCDTSRMRSILKQLFLGAKIEKVDYNTAKGQRIATDFDIGVLPAYIFDSNLNNTSNFKDTKRTFIEKNNAYIMVPSATGANYFFKRKEIKNTLQLYILPETEDENEENVADVLNLFGNDIDFEKIEVTDKKQLKEELAITTYPAFLVNNQLKFQGIQPPETIKQKFCELNDLDECEVELSLDIK